MTTIYQEITDSIIQQLESGVAPWIKPWRTGNNGAERNVVRETYRGINQLLLSMQSVAKGYDSNLWGTYQDWQKLEGNVRKGEKGTKIIKYGTGTSKTNFDKNGNPAGYIYIKAFWVFNLAQVDGIEIEKPETEQTEIERIAHCESTIAATKAVISHGGDSAFYMPSTDSIRLPELSSFHSTENYYATAFHELVHWTSEKTRCDRDLSKGRFGNSEYAFEELVAELGAAFLCGTHNISGDLRHAAYIQSWLKCLKNDNQAIFRASALAQKGADYVMNCALPEIELLAA